MSVHLSDVNPVLEPFRQNGSDAFYYKSLVDEVVGLYSRLHVSGHDVVKWLRGKDADDDPDAPTMLGDASSSQLYRDYASKLADVGIIGHLLIPIILLYVPAKTDHHKAYLLLEYLESSLE